MNLFRTSDLALAPFLVINGLEFLATELSQDDENEVVFVFNDVQNRGRDLAMLWHRSAEKTYHGLWSYFRGELGRAKKTNALLGNKK